jgi:tetratricopeptide (TPR) repeat protein
MKYLIIIAGLTAFCLGCNQNRIVKEKDYQPFLNPVFYDEAVKKTQLEMDFWNQRLLHDTGSYLNMLQIAHHNLSLFQLTGNMKNLMIGDSLFQQAAEKLNNTDPDIIQARCRVAITKHEFTKVTTDSEKALRQKGSRYAHALLAFDAGMETGQYHTAALQLNQLIDKSSFNFLIRKARYEDHKGNIEIAIKNMELAFEKITHTNNKEVYCWTLSNLGDMYGHAGRVKDAYKSYLKTLQKDPSHLHSLKGIAWIAYAHDHNVNLALEILHFIRARTNDPEILLTIAEIMEFMGNSVAKVDYLQQFLSMTSHLKYGGMYNKYLIELLAVNPTSHSRSLALAQKEVANRPTPETYSWLAWVQYQMGNHEKAYSLYKTYIEGRTFEPDVLIKAANILAGVGKKEKAIDILKKCLKNSYEIGPLKTKQIKSELSRCK